MRGGGGRGGGGGQSCRAAGLWPGFINIRVLLSPLHAPPQLNHPHTSTAKQRRGHSFKYLASS